MLGILHKSKLLGIIEFVILLIFYICRLREGKEQDRDATLAALVCRTFRDHTIVFVRTKADAHRVKILLGLFGLKVKKYKNNDIIKKKFYLLLKSIFGTNVV